MKKRQILIGGLIGVMLAMALVPALVLAEAPTRNTQTFIIEGIEFTFSTPATYAECEDFQPSDRIYTVGIPDSWTLKGWVAVQYVMGPDRLTVPGGDYPIINHPGDLDLTVYYPPVSQWPVQSNGTKEIHVDLSIEIYIGEVMVATLGPSQDWDVFCLGDPPTSTPTSTPIPFGGCTPGYWKQSQHFDSWLGFLPNQSFEAVFGRDVPRNPTLLDALGMNGGGLSALMRHATASLLNASNPAVVVEPAFDTTAEVIAAFQAAFDSGNYEPTKDLFAKSNERLCPLN